MYVCYEICKIYFGKVFSYMKFFKICKIIKEGFGRLINFWEEFCFVIVGYIILFFFYSLFVYLNDVFGFLYDIICLLELFGNE